MFLLVKTKILFIINLLGGSKARFFKGSKVIVLAPEEGGDPRGLPQRRF